MTPSPEEQAKLDELNAIAVEQAADGEELPAISVGFVATILNGFYKLRDRVDSLLSQDGTTGEVAMLQSQQAGQATELADHESRLAALELPTRLDTWTATTGAKLEAGVFPDGTVGIRLTASDGSVPFQQTA